MFLSPFVSIFMEVFVRKAYYKDTQTEQMQQFALTTQIEPADTQQY